MKTRDRPKGFQMKAREILKKLVEEKRRTIHRERDVSVTSLGNDNTTHIRVAGSSGTPSGRGVESVHVIRQQTTGKVVSVRLHKNKIRCCACV